MKKTLIALLVVASAFAYTRKISYPKFLRIIKEAKDIVENADCTFKSMTDDDGTYLQLIEDKKKVQIYIPETATITLKGRSEPDGSYENYYTIDGIGQLYILHVDDARDSVKLTNNRQQTARCDVDY